MIYRIKCKGSTAQYYSKFNIIAFKLVQNDEIKELVYYEDLKDVVKDYKIDNIPITYKNLVEELIKINNRFYKRRIKRGE